MQMMEREMKELHSRVTAKGQVTIPVEVRRSLGIAQGDKVAFVIEKSGVRLKRTGSVVEATFGALKSDQPALSAEEERRVVEEAIAQEAVHRLGG